MTTGNSVWDIVWLDQEQDVYSRTWHSSNYVTNNSCRDVKSEVSNNIIAIKAFAKDKVHGQFW